jgi:hypothetical protein
MISKTPNHGQHSGQAEILLGIHGDQGQSVTASGMSNTAEQREFKMPAAVPLQGGAQLFRIPDLKPGVALIVHGRRYRG